MACEKTSEAIAIDPLDHALCLETAKQMGWKITIVANTHHHHDHIGGNGPVIAATGAELVSHKDGMDAIPNFNRGLMAGYELQCGDFILNVLDTPGHTMSHICLYFPGSADEQPALFCGDTLFAGGCVRVFEGKFDQMYESLNKLKVLPENTSIYCGHEYTLSNLKFAKEAEPFNQNILSRYNDILKLRETGTPSLPSLLSTELKTNPFLRSDIKEVQENISTKFKTTKETKEIFKALRTWKDNF